MDDALIERIRITSRGYELSASGVLSMATFLRYLEHLRWSTIVSSEKLPLRQFWALGVVRSQAVEIYDQVSFGAELELSMWLARVGRSSMDFSHDITRATDGSLVGRSTATIVALDSDRRPAVIGDGARAYVLAREAIVPDRFDGAPAPAHAWKRRVELRPSDHDLQQHVNHARYAELVDDTRLLAAAADGYGPGYYGGHVRRLSISYEQESRVGDDVVAHTFRTPDESRSVDVILTKGGGTVVTRARLLLEGG
ncbi:MAG TPA: hotdog domain-containing protein [Polyangiaceae bacterium]|nr:hotdog domain-containing protein [Polyangiaceae bacterium]